MTAERDILKSRAVQAGFVMRSYRESYLKEDGRRGLTQEELLRRMGNVDEAYSERYNHATVSRWENGGTRPTVGRIKVFGQALGLTETETAGLILLAGLAPDFRAAGQILPSGNYENSNIESFEEWNSPPGDITFEANSGNLAGELFLFLVLRVLPLGLLIIGLGYALSFLDWGVAWTPVAYTGLVVTLVLGTAFVFPSQTVPSRDFFWVSLFFILTTPLLQFAPIQMDHYNFYTLGDIDGTHLPYMLALLLNLVLASTAAAMCHILWKWQYKGNGAARNAFRRAAWVTIPPAFFVYAVVIVTSNASVSIQLSILIPALALCFAGLLILGDPSLRPSERDQRILFPAAVALAIVSSVAGMIVVISVYVSPDLPSVLPDHNLLSSWEIDFDELGYSREEALERVNLGYLWHAMCVLVYMSVVLGGNVLVAFYRMADPRSPLARAVSD